MSVVTVLIPTGHRQNVKVTPNTTMLQVLEEVCQKHGFKPEEYDIRHHNKILDVTTTFRFSGLPNNAQLELVEALKQRSESPVILGLQMESGNRFTGEFNPSDNLWHVVKTLIPENANPTVNPVIIYMRKEIYGIEDLQKTTLKSIGLTGGRAMLRFFNKTPEELKKQANVSAVYSRPIIIPENQSQKKKEEQNSPPAKHKQNSPEPISQHSSEPQDKTQKKEETSLVNEPKWKEKSPDVLKKLEKNINKEESKSQAAKTVKFEADVTPKPDLCKNEEPEIPPHRDLQVAAQKGETVKEPESKVILLGDRNAIAFNLNNIKQPAFEDVSDDFFELTVSDAKLLLRDAKRFCAELDNAPLVTSAQRELEHNKKILTLLNQYKKTVLRIKFPDRTVLQGTFSPVDAVSSVEKFVSSYLENPDLKFYLYTTPPKSILKSDDRLIECNCVPCAVLYFGVAGNEIPQQYLRSEVLDKLSTPSGASLAAYESRGMNQARKSVEEKENSELENELMKTKPSSNVSEPGPSRIQNTRNRQDKEQNAPPFKVPKWFKATK